MRIRIAVLAAAAATFSLACQDTRDTSPAGPPSFAGGAALTCDFGQAIDYTRRYLAEPQRSAAYGLILQMKTQLGGGDSAAATSTGFEILGITASATDAGAQAGSPQDGSNQVNAVLACMKVGAVNLPIDFSQALSVGAFAVRAGPGDPTGPIISRDDFSGIALAPELNATWLSVLGQRAVLYGEPNPAASFNELLAGLPYTWSTVPVIPKVNKGAVIGFCVENPGRLRVADDHGGPETILFLRDPSFFLACPNLASAGEWSPGWMAGLGRSLKRTAGRIFLPAPLAAAMKNPGPVGGSATGFSDFAAVDAIAINLTWTGQPSGGTAGQTLPAVQVKATGNGGTPLPQVTITLSLVRVSGTGNLQGTLSKVTDTGGVETYPDLVVTRPGTYALLATASASGFGTVQLQSVNFVVQ